MRFYKAIKGGKHDYFTGNTTVKNELLTPRERNTKFRYLTEDNFIEVEVNKNKTYWCFGCRFKIGEGCDRVVKA